MISALCIDVGRSIAGVDVHSYINNLPFAKDTTRFTTADASGSTSQAANIVEALEQGSTLLLLDEDTCATNFMVRDKLMQQLVPRDKEPITPFISSVRHIYENVGASVVMVVGSAGDYFSVADHVLMMDHYRPVDVTKRAKAIAAAADAITTGTATIATAGVAVAPKSTEGSDSAGFTNDAATATGKSFAKPRQIDRGSFKRIVGQRCFARTLGCVQLSRDPLPDGTFDELDLSSVEQLVEKGQTRAIAGCLQLLHSRTFITPRAEISLKSLLEQLEALLDEKVANNEKNKTYHDWVCVTLSLTFVCIWWFQGLDYLSPEGRLQGFGVTFMHFFVDITLTNLVCSGDVSRPRRFEIAAAINRFRGLRTQHFVAR